MTRRQNLHYKISSQQKIKTEDEYVPKSAQNTLEMSVEKLMKEGKYFQALYDKHSQVISECQLKLKSLFNEARDLNIVGKRSLPS